MQDLEDFKFWLINREHGRHMHMLMGWLRKQSLAYKIRDNHMWFGKLYELFHGYFDATRTRLERMKNDPEPRYNFLGMPREEGLQIMLGLERWHGVYPGNLNHLAQFNQRKRDKPHHGKKVREPLDSIKLKLHAEHLARVPEGTASTSVSPETCAKMTDPAALERWLAFKNKKSFKWLKDMKNKNRKRRRGCRRRACTFRAYNHSKKKELRMMRRKYGKQLDIRPQAELVMHGPERKKQFAAGAHTIILSKRHFKKLRCLRLYPTNGMNFNHAWTKNRKKSCFAVILKKKLKSFQDAKKAKIAEKVEVKKEKMEKADSRPDVVFGRFTEFLKNERKIKRKIKREIKSEQAVKREKNAETVRAKEEKLEKADQRPDVVCGRFKEELARERMVRREAKIEHGLKQEVKFEQDGVKQEIKCEPAVKHEIKAEQAMKFEMESDAALKQEIKCENAVKSDIKFEHAAMQGTKTEDPTGRGIKRGVKPEYGVKLEVKRENATKQESGHRSKLEVKSENGPKKENDATRGVKREIKSEGSVKSEQAGKLAVLIGRKDDYESILTPKNYSYNEDRELYGTMYETAFPFATGNEGTLMYDFEAGHDYFAEHFKIRETSEAKRKVVEEELKVMEDAQIQFDSDIIEKLIARDWGPSDAAENIDLNLLRRMKIIAPDFDAAPSRTDTRGVYLVPSSREGSPFVFTYTNFLSALHKQMLKQPALPFTQKVAKSDFLNALCKLSVYGRTGRKDNLRVRKAILQSGILYERHIRRYCEWMHKHPEDPCMRHYDWENQEPFFPEWSPFSQKSDAVETSVVPEPTPGEDSASNLGPSRDETVESNEAVTSFSSQVVPEPTPGEDSASNLGSSRDEAVESNEAAASFSSQVVPEATPSGDSAGNLGSSRDKTVESNEAVTSFSSQVVPEPTPGEDSASNLGSSRDEAVESNKAVTSFSSQVVPEPTPSEDSASNLGSSRDEAVESNEAVTSFVPEPTPSGDSTSNLESSRDEAVESNEAVTSFSSQVVPEPTPRGDSASNLGSFRDKTVESNEAATSLSSREEIAMGFRSEILRVAFLAEKVPAKKVTPELFGHNTLKQFWEDESILKEERETLLHLYLPGIYSPLPKNSC